MNKKVDQRAEGVTMVPLLNVHPAPDNPRQELGDLTDLRNSITTQGILQPLVVSTTGADGQLLLDEHYMVVIGHRRLAAAAELGLAEVPCIVRKFTDVQRVEAFVVENAQRVDLSPLEEAAAFAKLTSPPIGLSQRQVAERVGRSQAHVSKRLALLALPEEARAAVDSGRITHDDAALLTKLADHPERLLDSLRAAQNGLLGRRVGEHLNELLAAEAQKATRALLDAEGITVLGHAKSRWENAWSLGKPHVVDCPADGPYTDEILAAKKKLGAFINFDGGVTYVSTEAQPSARARKETPEQAKWRSEQEERERERAAQRAAAAARREALKEVVAGRMAAVHRDYVLRMAPYMDSANRESDEVADLLGLELPDDVSNFDELEEFTEAWVAGGPDRDLRLAYSCALVDAENDAFSKVVKGIHQRHLEVLGLVAKERGEVDADDLAIERITFDSPHAKARIRVFPHDDGWVSAIDYSFSRGSGESYTEPVSIERGEHRTRERAIDAAAERIQAAAQAVVDRRASTVTTAQQSDGRAMRRWAAGIAGQYHQVEEGAGEPAQPESTSPDIPASPSVADGIRRAQAELDAEGPLRTDPEVGDFGDPVVPLDEAQACPVCVKLVNGKCRVCGREVRLDYVDGKPVTKAVGRSVA